MAFILSHQLKYSGDLAEVYFAGDETGRHFFNSLMSLYQKEYGNDMLAIIRKLLTFKDESIIEEDFRSEFDNEEITAKNEGDELVKLKALYYKSPIENEDNKFRVYCIWPVMDDERIIIIGGGCKKEQGGPLQHVPECFSSNNIMRDICGDILTEANRSLLFIKDGKLECESEKIIIK